MATDRKAYFKAYREANKEKRNAYSKKYHAKNRSSILARAKTYGVQYRQDNKDLLKEKNKTFRENNKGIINANKRKYQQSKLDNNYIITELDKFVEQEMYDLAQLRSETLGKDWHVDHTIPLSKGGPHAIHNLEVVPKAWNLSKGNRNSNRYREITC